MTNKTPNNMDARIARQIDFMRALEIVDDLPIKQTHRDTIRYALQAAADAVPPLPQSADERIAELEKALDLAITGIKQEKLTEIGRRIVEELERVLSTPQAHYPEPTPVYDAAGNCIGSNGHNPVYQAHDDRPRCQFCGEHECHPKWVCDAKITHDTAEGNATMTADEFARGWMPFLSKQQCMRLSLAIKQRDAALLTAAQSAIAELVEALGELVERIDINGGIGEYKGGRAFIMAKARQLIAKHSGTRDNEAVS